ncbi:hypothetical protein J7I94_13750 [Streptomyces sp. ISL-12]|uniref:hypothetical protein n=1 Tax=Streptomyces sp. ISL-12 TaxID=2819177 RepID=UPI001BE527E7|nr:hypothetical protein [Streptomyces sp. ISL-12]MBT2411619.1 hypothetical protein [Streptomyces sp. ISL-12]
MTLGVVCTAAVAPLGIAFVGSRLTGERFTDYVSSFPDHWAVVVGAGVGVVASVISWRETARAEARRRAEARASLREAENRLTSVLAGERDEIPTVPQQSDGPAGPRDAAGHASPHPRPTERAEQRDHRAHKLALASLWDVTHSRLALYHDIATGQAKRSFISAQIAMALGFLLLIGFVAAAVQAEKTAAAAVAGALGAVAAALAAFISRTFIKSQETAAEHLKAYFDQPLEFSRYLAAERLLNDAKLTDDQRAEVVGELVKLIAAGPPNPLVDAGANVLEQLPKMVQGEK